MAIENEDFTNWKCQYQQEPVEIPDCNDCVFLNVTEDVQTESATFCLTYADITIGEFYMGL